MWVIHVILGQQSHEITLTRPTQKLARLLWFTKNDAKEKEREEEKENVGTVSPILSFFGNKKIENAN